MSCNKVVITVKTLFFFLKVYVYNFLLWLGSNDWTILWIGIYFKITTWEVVCYSWMEKLFLNNDISCINL